jgi:hypothetical protein
MRGSNTALSDAAPHVDATSRCLTLYQAPMSDCECRSRRSKRAVTRPACPASDPSVVRSGLRPFSRTELDCIRAICYIRLTVIVYWSATPSTNDGFGSSLLPLGHDFTIVSGISVLWTGLTPTWICGISVSTSNSI